MEKMRSLDGKLKHQIDRLMKLSTQSTEGSSSLRPNPLALLSKGGDDEEEEDYEYEGNGSGSGRKGSKVDKGEELYRAPKMSAAPYKVRVCWYIFVCVLVGVRACRREYLCVCALPSSMSCLSIL